MENPRVTAFTVVVFVVFRHRGGGGGGGGGSDAARVKALIPFTGVSDSAAAGGIGVYALSSTN